jgi:outer membrane protein assembly factor BamD
MSDLLFDLFAPMLLRARLGRADLNRISVTHAAAVLAVGLVLGLSACSNGDEEITYVEQPVGQLYNEAMDELLAENYEPAAQLFDEVERQHPYSVWATKGQLMAAFAYYQRSNYAEAVVTLDRFIQLHPAHENVDYAYYLRAMCYYEQITDVARDQRMTERARDALEEAVNRFPEGAYAADAERKLVLVRDQLAGKEIEIGRYYQKRGHYLAAINRFRKVVEDYQTTSHVPEALHRLTELYLALGVTDEAQRTAAVLGYNYQGSQWYRDSYALLTGGRNPVVSAEPGQDDRSFLARTWDWIF